MIKNILTLFLLLFFMSNNLFSAEKLKSSSDKELNFNFKNINNISFFPYTDFLSSHVKVSQYNYSSESYSYFDRLYFLNALAHLFVNQYFMPYFEFITSALHPIEGFRASLVFFL